ncbi:hypothetical protein QTP88_019943 [Uroleucon formosanum]
MSIMFNTLYNLFIYCYFYSQSFINNTTLVKILYFTLRKTRCVLLFLLLTAKFKKLLRWSSVRSII